MSQGPNKLFDDFAKLMTDAAGAAQGLRREAETAFKTQAERFMSEMDIVRRDEGSGGERGAEGAHRGAGSPACGRSGNRIMKNAIVR
jgi:hypothetical protein